MPQSASNTSYSSINITIQVGTRVSLHNLDLASSHLSGLQGLVIFYQAQTGTYGVQLDNGWGTFYAPPHTLLQNINVQLRFIGSVATIVSYMEMADLYSVRYISGALDFVPSRHIIIPNGTVVRLEGLRTHSYNGRHGKVVSWVPRTDQCTGYDSSCYDIQLSYGSTIRVQMDNVRL